jgi:hypothetical protein
VTYRRRPDLVDVIDEIGMKALHYLIESIHKQNGIACFALTPWMRKPSIFFSR